MEKVTIVIPTYNNAPYIQLALQSIYRQTYKHWKLLIIDDGSTDGTVARIKPLVDLSRTRVKILKQNSGICRVLNYALQQIDTEYFLQVDGDDWIEPETLEIMVHAMERSSSSTALVYANTMHWYEKAGKLRFHKVVKPRKFHSRYEFAMYDPMVHPRFYRTSCVKKVGGWEIDTLTWGRMMEGRRLLLRLLDRYSFGYIDCNLYHFRYHQTNLSLDQNAPIYNQLRKLYTDKALQRWGNLYTAEMVGPTQSWQSLRLIPKIPRKG
ncbi:glycosyltransferase family 2 protein [Paenibacillus sp. CAA11]|uniref:glycosyltransferase family 2 protein n=1 Tax=Paenibacillus sp. CAA11 TaxID=1532905 RepID=UPI000D376A5F|nr:glycosyltransferase family A protein [Paenibacillus sp. CAA11]AWB43991.1 glycosyltransferase family 2 protein [Paenibacillus sp. CAA11]